MQYSSLQVSSQKLHGSTRFPSWVSSFNLWKPHLCLHITRDTGCVYRVNRTEPSTDPWGTPYRSRAGLDGRPFTTTDWNLSLTYESNHHLSAISQIPKVVSNLRKRIEWSINCCRQIEQCKYRHLSPISLVKQGTGDFQKNSLGALVLSVYRLVSSRRPYFFFSRWVWSCDKSSLSRIFDRKRRFDAGL